MKFVVTTVFALLAGILLMTTGCQTTVTDREALAFTAGVAAAYAYTNESSSLTPEQKKMAKEAIKVFKSIGSSVNEQNINNLGPVIDAQIDKNVSDPQQRQMAKSFAAVLLQQAKPYMENQTVKDSILIFAAFCRGVGTADTGKMISL
jgi:hypothetical protein